MQTLQMRRQLQRQPGSVNLPWLRSEMKLLDDCLRCDDCSTACPQQIIIKDEQGFPVINFSHEGCSLCARCVDACKVTSLFDRTQAAFEHYMTITAVCLPQQGVACQSCAEACETQALQLSWNEHRLRVPAIATTTCTGCGVCVSVCPADAIQILSLDNRSVYP